MKCPCCKVINSLDEALKHRSVTSSQAAVRAWTAFIEMDKTALVLAIYPCPKHGTGDGYASFMDEANARKQQIVNRARAEREKQAAENLDRMIRNAAAWIFVGLRRGGEEKGGTK